MPLTDHCDIFAALHEKAINNVVLRLQQQRPSLFNYGTISFVNDPRTLCDQTILRSVDRDVALFGNPVVTEEPLLGIPGYAGPYGLEFCFQLSELSVDFHPGNVHALPPELTPPLKPQRFSLKARVCAGLSCPGNDILKKLAAVPTRSPKSPPADPKQPAGRDDRPDHRTTPLAGETPTHTFPFDPRSVLCFCIDLFAVLHLERQGSAEGPVITLNLDNLELVDIKPANLEDSLECYIKTVLMLSVLPRVRLALSSLVFHLGDVLTIGPTPISAAVPFNPAVENDQIKLFVDVT